MNGRAVINEALELVFPSGLYCMCCGDMLHKSRLHGLCDDCVSKLKWCAGDPFGRRAARFSFCGVMSLAEYDFYSKRMIYALKFSRKSYMARGLGRLMGELYLANGAEALSEFFSGFASEIFVPVPMHRAKERLRGYNQAALLAKYAARAAGRSFIPDALIKTEAGPAMRTARGADRRHLLDGAISINEKRVSELKGRGIVLVDDVITTGSTAESCASALIAAGSGPVRVLSFAAVNYEEK